MFLQLLPVHHEVSDKVRFFDAHIHLEQMCEIQRSIDHILVVSAAEVVDAAGQRHRGEKVCDDLPHIAHAPVVAAGKVQRFAGLRGLQKVQRQIAPDGQPTAREIIHPR